MTRPGVDKDSAPSKNSRVERARLAVATADGERNWTRFIEEGDFRSPQQSSQPYTRSAGLEAQRDVDKQRATEDAAANSDAQAWKSKMQAASDAKSKEIERREVSEGDAKKALEDKKKAERAKRLAKLREKNIDLEASLPDATSAPLPPQQQRDVEKELRLLAEQQDRLAAQVKVAQQQAAEATPAPTPSPTAPAVNAVTKAPSPKKKKWKYDRKNVAVIVLAYNRPVYLQRTLQSLTDLDEFSEYTKYVSQDGNNVEVANVVDRFPAFKHFVHDRVPLLAPDQKGIAYLAQHYKYAMERVFMEFKHSHAIIVEDDMIFSPDFLRLFEETAFVLEEDPTVWCVSSWNDNGFEHLAKDKTRLFRTNYFPGLGWMLRRELWLELREKWPLEAWDHWMRVDAQHKGRDCLVPEISRNYNIGEHGVNINPREYKKFLQTIRYNDDPDVSFGNCRYLLAENYENIIKQLVEDSTLLQHPAEVPAHSDGSPVYLLVYLRENFKQYADTFKIWANPRAHHKGTMIFQYNGAWVVLADARASEFLPEALRVRPSPKLTIHPGSQHSSCDFVCSEKGLRCDVTQFPFLNNCTLLFQNFPCERGCDYNIGNDIPCYVSDPTNVFHHGKCMVTDILPNCQHSHKSTSRLCPCSP